MAADSTWKGGAASDESRIWATSPASIVAIRAGATANGMTSANPHSLPASGPTQTWRRTACGFASSKSHSATRSAPIVEPITARVWSIAPASSALGARARLSAMVARKSARDTILHRRGKIEPEPPRE